MKRTLRIMVAALSAVTAGMFRAPSAQAGTNEVRSVNDALSITSISVLSTPSTSRSYRDCDADLDHYRRYPRRRPIYESSASGPRVLKEFHAGFQDPDGDPGAQTLFGVRIAALPDPHIGIGGMLDWSHRGETVTQVISSMPGPGGTTITTQREYARASADLLPVLAFLHVSGDNARPVIPYGGLGGGLEVLFLSAEDFRTGDKYDATFAGWGWQAWGGVAVPLSSHSRFNAEVFRNVGDLSRDTDESSGARVREKVDVDAVGMRFGISFGF